MKTTTTNKATENKGISVEIVNYRAGCRPHETLGNGSVGDCFTTKATIEEARAWAESQNGALAYDLRTTDGKGIARYVSDLAGGWNLKA